MKYASLKPLHWVQRAAQSVTAPTVARSMGYHQRRTFTPLRPFFRVRKELSLPLSYSTGPDGVDKSSLSSESPLMGQWWCLWAHVAFVGFLTFDLFGDASWHLFQPLDLKIHSWVSSHIPPQSQNLFFDKLLSDVPIVLPLILWLVLELPISLQSLRSAWEARVTSSSVKLGGVALGVMSGSLLVKELFQRPRPHVLPHNFSFPSGHTLAAVMIGGMFLFFKLEPFLKQRALEERLPRGIPLELCLVAVWCILGGAVATGRVGADAHWLSDTLISAAVGSLTVIALRIAQMRSDSCNETE